MLKKFAIILVLLIVIIAGLQLFGGRDFTQLGTAWDKYQYGGDLTGLVGDVGIIFSGDKVSEAGLATAKMAERLYYRWIDENGVEHNSERMPDVENYEVVRMGDLKIKTQKAMDEEEIKRALKN